MATEAPPELLIREFREEDLETCRKIGQTQFDYTEYITLPGYRFFVCEIAGQVVGFAAIQVWQWNRSAWISETMVMPAFRRRGVGTALFERLAQDARAQGCRVLIDYVPTDSALIAFYFSRGLRVIGYHSLFFDHPDPVLRGALIVGLDLT